MSSVEVNETLHESFRDEAEKTAKILSHPFLWLGEIRRLRTGNNQKLRDIEAGILNHERSLDEALPDKVDTLKVALALAAFEPTVAQGFSPLYSWGKLGTSYFQVMDFENGKVTGERLLCLSANVDKLAKRYNASERHLSMIRDAEILYTVIKEISGGSMLDEPNPVQS